jgi:hypothetical protein
VIGYRVAGPPIVPATDLQSQDTVLPTAVPVLPTRIADDVASPTRLLDTRSGLGGQTIGAGGVTVPPFGDYAQTGPPVYPITPGGQGLRVPAALATGLMLAMLLVLGALGGPAARAFAWPGSPAQLAMR